MLWPSFFYLDFKSFYIPEPDLPTYLVFYLKTTRGSSIYSTYLIYSDLFKLHAADDANNDNDDSTL